MKLVFDKIKEELDLKIKYHEQMYGDIVEKVLNENSREMHTMLMKSDFQNYLEINDLEIQETLAAEKADLADLNLYEKELAKIGGNQTR